MKLIKLAVLLSATGLSFFANALTIHSSDIREGYPLAEKFAFNGWGCSGKNLSPQISWRNIPAGTKSFAITVFDPDAPTGSGFWHWIATDIPVTRTNLTQGVDLNKMGATVFRNDYGNYSYGGACPPVGDGMHRYEFTVWALPVEKLDLPSTTSAAVVGFNLNARALDKAVLTATYTSN